MINWKAESSNEIRKKTLGFGAPVKQNVIHWIPAKGIHKISDSVQLITFEEPSLMLFQPDLV